MEQLTTPGDELAEAIRFQRDLYLYWRVAEEMGSLPLSPRRFVSRPVLRRLRERLALPGNGPSVLDREDPAEGEDPRLYFLRRLLERLGLLRAAPDTARLLPASRAEMLRYLAHPLARRLRIGARLWVAGGWWPDRPDARGVPPRIMMPAPPRIAIARRRLLAVLTTLPPGAPVPLPGSAATGESGAAWSASPRARRMAVGFAEEAAVARAALRGPLTWMGFVTAGPAASADAWLTERALAALREDDAVVLPEVPGRIVAQANLEVLAYPPLTAPVLAMLDTWADVETLSTVARYRLSRVALARAVRDGWTVARVAAALESLVDAPTPPNVGVLLADWERHLERVRLSAPVTVLETSAPLLDALLADPSAAGWVERRISPTAALLAPGGAERTRAWLLRRGELPALRSTLGATREAMHEAQLPPVDGA